MYTIILREISPIYKHQDREGKINRDRNSRSISVYIKAFDQYSQQNQNARSQGHRRLWYRKHSNVYSVGQTD